MALVVAGPGAATLGLFALVGMARVSDIVLTDGTTRTSVNASFQVVPVGERLAVQAVVEGIGVPVAIGATGVVLLAMNALGLGSGRRHRVRCPSERRLDGERRCDVPLVHAGAGRRGTERSLVAGGFEVAEDDEALHVLLALR